MKSFLEWMNLLAENNRQAKQYVEAGKLSKNDYTALLNADPSKTKKYVGWLAKMWIAKSLTDIDDARNTIEEFDVFANRKKTKYSDINQYRSFDELSQDIEKLNQTGEALSNKDLESDYEILVDNEDLIIACPNTHEASRKLGLSIFAYRSCKDGIKDSAWCTTYKAPNHFNDYYYKHNVTFYYVKIKSEEIQNDLKKAGFKPQHFVLAIAKLDDETGHKAKAKGYSNIDVYDGLDKQLSTGLTNKLLNIVGLKI